MYDPPTTAELVTAVREFLEEHALPNLEGRNAFHARVAANALAIVARQLELGPEAEAAEQQRLQALLGTQGSLDELNRELCRRIRNGDLAIDAAALVAPGGHAADTAFGAVGAGACVPSFAFQPPSSRLPAAFHQPSKAGAGSGA